MENIGGIFVVLICGLIVAIFMAMLEFLWTLRHSEATEVNLQGVWPMFWKKGQSSQARVQTKVTSDASCEIPWDRPRAGDPHQCSIPHTATERPFNVQCQILLWNSPGNKYGTVFMNNKVLYNYIPSCIIAKENRQKYQLPSGNRGLIPSLFTSKDAQMGAQELHLPSQGFWISLIPKPDVYKLY